MSTPGASGQQLNQALERAGLAVLDPKQIQQFEAYLALLLRWNQRINLTAIRDEAGILTRHFVESIAVAQGLPAGIESVLDFGSGAGLPGIPIAICRPAIAVMLAESQGKKAAFLREAVRGLGISAQVYAGRAEGLSAEFDCITMRAVEKMGAAVAAARKLVKRGGWLALMTTTGEFTGLRDAAGGEFSWEEPVLLPGGEQRILELGRLRRD